MSLANFQGQFDITHAWDTSHVAVNEYLVIAIDAKYNVTIKYKPGCANTACWATITAAYDPNLDIIRGQMQDGGTRYFSIALDRSSSDPTVVHAYVSGVATGGDFGGEPDDGSWTGTHHP